MSVGHHHFGTGRRIGCSQHVLQVILRDPKIKAYLARPFVYNFDYDIPYLCGYSQNGRTIYVDRHLPLTLRVQNKKVAVLQFLNLHERLEKACIDVYGWKYLRSHMAGTRWEHNAVVKKHLAPSAYEAALRPYIKATEHEKITKVPRDLDLHPYVDEHENALIRHMREAMV